MPLHHRPRASAEMVQSYAHTAVLAEERRAQVLGWGDGIGAVAWQRIAVYCRQMAETGAIDDDQFQFQRDQQRHRREVPMPTEIMDLVGLAIIGRSSQRKPLPEWKLAALELALGYLSPLQRICLELVVGGRLSQSEVAAALECPPADVRKHIARARNKIRNEIAPRVGPILSGEKPQKRTNLSTENVYR